jgi:hypothetical protein
MNGTLSLRLKQGIRRSSDPHRQVRIGAALALLNGPLFTASLRRCHSPAVLFCAAGSAGPLRASSRQENLIEPRCAC